jgi:t-SNARE complex subunit (syntaxin)
MRAVEVDALVAAAVQRAGGAPGVDEAELRRQAARDPVGFAAKQQAQLPSSAASVAGAASTATTYDEDAARARDIAALVRSTLEVQRLFTDVSALVAHQGEALDTVEAHVEAAGLHVVKGNTQLEGAIRRRRRRRRCMCCLCGTGAVLLVLAIIALSLFVTGAYKAIIP